MVFDVPHFTLENFQTSGEALGEFGKFFTAEKEQGKDQDGSNFPATNGPTHTLRDSIYCN